MKQHKGLTIILTLFGLFLTLSAFSHPHDNPRMSEGDFFSTLSHA